MNLFEEIEGSGGERLTSAVLRFLILRSQEFRENVIDLISRESEGGPVFLRESFSCRCEEATEDANRGRGRLDIVIETDNAVLGIENKLYAEFQPGQPEKYLEGIRSLAKSQGKMSLLVLLVPDERVAEVTTKVKNTGDSNTYVILSWQKVLDVQANNLNDMDATTKIALEQLKGYIASKCSGVPIHYQLNHLKGSIKPTGIHWEFLAFLRSVLPNSLTEGTRIRTGKGSVGSYLNSKSWIWFGFVSPDSVQAPQMAARCCCYWQMNLYLYRVIFSTLWARFKCGMRSEMGGRLAMMTRRGGAVETTGEAG